MNRLMMKSEELSRREQPLPLNLLAAEPARPDERLLREAIAYYQTAAHAFKKGALKLE